MQAVGHYDSALINRLFCERPSCCLPRSLGPAPKCEKVSGSDHKAEESDAEWKQTEYQHRAQRLFV